MLVPARELAFPPGFAEPQERSLRCPPDHVMSAEVTTTEGLSAGAGLAGLMVVKRKGNSVRPEGGRAFGWLGNNRHR